MDTMPNEPHAEPGTPYLEVSRDLSELADSVFETHAERPAEQVRAALELHAREHDIELNDEMLERLSTEISNGNRVEIGPV